MRAFRHVNYLEVAGILQAMCQDFPAAANKTASIPSCSGDPGQKMFSRKCSAAVWENMFKENNNKIKVSAKKCEYSVL